MKEPYAPVLSHGDLSYRSKSQTLAEWRLFMLKTNLIKKVASTLLVAGLVVSVGGTVTQAAFDESFYTMSFDAYYGDEYSYSPDRYKGDDSSGYVFLGNSSYSVDFCMPAFDGDVVESIPLPTVRVGSGQSSLITNWVYENGYEWAVLRGRATSDNYYSVSGFWSPTTN